MHLTLSLHRKGNVSVIETGGQALKNIVIDNTDIPEEQRGGTAKQLLGAAALYCYAASLTAAMEARALRYTSLNLSATLDVGNNEKGQSRVLKITITADVGIDEDDIDLFERVARVMKGGCLVTGSLHDGIAMVYELNPVYDNG